MGSVRISDDSDLSKVLPRIMNGAMGGLMPDPDEPSSKPLDYERPPAQSQGNRRQFWTGLIAGSVCSLIFWTTLVFHGLGGRPFVALFVFLAAKMLAGVLLSASARWRSAGSGLFISLGVGALISLGTCGLAAALS
jgi:hypothetical protein